MAEFFAMGGYGFYVWTSFGLTAIVLLGNLWFAHRRHIAVQALIRRQLSAETEAPNASFKEVMT